MKNSNIQIVGKAKTSPIDDNINPNWVMENLEITYQSVGSEIKFDVLDENNIVDDDRIGYVRSSIAELTNNKFRLNKFGYQHHNLDKGGVLCIQSLTAEEMNNMVEMQISGCKMPKEDTFGKCDPYIEVYLIDDIKLTPEDQAKSDNNLLIWKSSVQKKTYKPNWGTTSVPLKRFGKDPLTTHFQIIVWDDDVGQKPDLVGYSQPLQLQEILNQSNSDGYKIPLSLKKDKNRGVIVFNNARCISIK